jgi:hypothetical protein
VAIAVPAIAAGGTQGTRSPMAKPIFSGPAAFDVSPPLSELANSAMRRSVPAVARTAPRLSGRIERDVAIEGSASASSPWAPAWLSGNAVAPMKAMQSDGASIASPLVNFEGLRNEDNFAIFGGRVNPPDPVGDVGPNHYVEMVNLVFAVYSKTGALVLGPVDTGSLWAGFPIDECTEPSGDPIVLYDQFADRWILTQFTTRGINYPDEPLNLFYNCVAISTTADPTGSYYRYAFTTGYNFPDYPKYGVWGDSYLIATREFGILDPNVYGIGVYGLERRKMIKGNPNARSVSFLLREGDVALNLIGDGLLPPDVDGKRAPEDDDSPAPFVGTQDDDYGYGAPFDALNIWEFEVEWEKTPDASIKLKKQLPVNEFDSDFPCGVVPGSLPPDARDCLPQPGITNGSQYLDILSYRQRPTWRLAYRNFDDYESLVTNQSIEARPGVAGVRWYEIRRNEDGKYSLRQQGDYAPNDGVHRWMGSIAQDKKQNMALGYSVVNGTDVYPGIRYTGRRKSDPRGQMTLGEGVIINGTGVQTSTNSRWGDYTSMNIDPVDDCTFWYVNEYYQVSGTPADTRPWQTRIASFKLPGC